MSEHGQQEQREHRLRQLRRQKRLKMKEAVLTVLVVVFAGLSVFVAQDDTALGLLVPSAKADNLPVVTQFQTDVLTNRETLGLDRTVHTRPTEQQEVHIVDPTNPPPVTAVEAIDTHVGGEVAVFWELPNAVEMVDIDRIVGSGRPETIAQNVAAEKYVDSEAKDGTTYTYRIRSVMEEDGERYRSTPVEVSATPSDAIPPHPPLDVQVTRGETAEEIILLWEDPTDTDLSQLAIYRSDREGERGEIIGAADVGDNGFIDDTVEVNATYYYTVVALDATGNESAPTFYTPPAGNPEPFTPFDERSASFPLLTE